MPKTNRILVFVGVVIYAILFVLVGLYVFVENDERQPLVEIFQWQYLIPVMIYSLFSLWVSYGLFLLLNKLFGSFLSIQTLSRAISFPLSLIIGIPVGVYGLDRILRLLTA